MALSRLASRHFNSLVGIFFVEMQRRKFLKTGISAIAGVSVSANFSFAQALKESSRNLSGNKTEYDLVINVDVASIERTCDAQILFEKAKFTVNIDHHKTNNAYGDLNFINPDASSTGEVLFDCFRNMDWKINYDTAVCLYTAILTDTGSFRFDNTKPSTFETASKLVELGVQPSDIYKRVYESDSKTLVMFQAYCISKAKFLDDDKIAYTVVYKKDMEKFSAGDDCMEGLTEKLRAIVTTRIAFVAKEMKSGGTKISMRSKFADVAEICAVFGGGGHKFAAGCTIKAPVEQAVKRMLDEIKKREI